MNLSYKYRLYPSEEDQQELERHLDLCRQVYNYFLERVNEAKEAPSRERLQGHLPEMKDEWPELRQVHSKVLQMVLKQLYDNMKVLSRRKEEGYKVGGLRYKGEGWFKTFKYNQSGFKIRKTGTRLDRLWLSKIGTIPIRIHRKLEGDIKGVIIKKDSAGDWYAIFQVQQKPGESDVGEKEGIEAVGIDLGIRHFITDSDGNRVEHPKNVGKAEERLKKEQRDLSRKQKGSNNWKKQRRRVAKIHKTVKNRRRDFLHKLSTAYVQNYDVIVLEDLNTSEMMEDEMNSEHIQDAAWRVFIQMLLYKAESAGTEVVLVDPKDTTRECSQCGTTADKPLSQRKHSCPDCGYETDRDYNAARNILGRGLAEVTPADTGAATDTDPEFRDVSARTVVETGSLSSPEAAPEGGWR